MTQKGRDFSSLSRGSKRTYIPACTAETAASHIMPTLAPPFETVMSISPPVAIQDLNNPWKSDAFGLEPFGRGLEAALGHLPKPLCLSVDGAWGSGKTSFLRMWQQHMANQGHHCVRFDAWQHDYCHHALLAIVHDILQSCGGLQDPLAQEVWKAARRIAPRVMKQFLRDLLVGGLDRVSGGMVRVDNLVEAGLAATDESLFTAHTEDLEEMKGLQESFKQLIEKTLTATPLKSFIVIIDELDRCKPTFALELLEGVKHLFAVSDRVVFVFGIDRQQLAHTVSGAYGPGFNGLAYLRRIIELDFHLPAPDSFLRLPFAATEAIKSAGLCFGAGERGKFMSAIVAGFRMMPRDVQQWIARIAMRNDRSSAPDHDLAIFLLALHQVNPRLYDRLLQYGVDGREAREELHALYVFDHLDLQPRLLPEGWSRVPCPLLAQLCVVTADIQASTVQYEIASDGGRERSQALARLDIRSNAYVELVRRRMYQLGFNDVYGPSRFYTWKKDLSAAFSSASG